MDRPIWLAAGVRTPFTRVDGGLAKRGAIALGIPVLHPFGATGARILTQAVKEIAAMRAGARGIVSICADGGLGTVALIAA